MENPKKKPPVLTCGKHLAYLIFETWEGIGVVTGLAKTTCRAWRNNNIPTKHRAAICAAAITKGWDVEEDDFRGDL